MRQIPLPIERETSSNDWFAKAPRLSGVCKLREQGPTWRTNKFKQHYRGHILKHFHLPLIAYPPPSGNSSSSALSSRAIRAKSVAITPISWSLFRVAIAIARLGDLTGASSLPSFLSSPLGRI